ncbi:hypothetical protein B0T19DRAFT_452900 [Cercophora scortea]|uniref:Uncharacterized protein n=1 Tax=Cercophora scortea TaxID=314031 RepID=A0AAE0MKE8_9PEZI|nr:hypothetical protein B0T19DRAFT_452900 [Cercophora scortea]
MDEANEAQDQLSLEPTLRNLVNIVRLWFRFNFMRDEPNPVHIALAGGGYWLQSHVLCISDRYGYFSPGPWELQLDQGASLAIVMMLLTLVNSIFLLMSLCEERPFEWNLFGLLAVGNMLMYVYLWLGSVLDKRRKPDFDWARYRQRERDLERGLWKKQRKA